MGNVNGFGIYEYDRTDVGIGPALLNLQSAAISAMLNETAPITRVANVAARSTHATAYAATRGAISPSNPCIVWRGDAADGEHLEYTINGTTWQGISPKASTGVITGLSGWDPEATIHRQGGFARMEGFIRRTASNFSLTTSFTSVGTIPAGFRPTGTFYGVSDRGPNVVMLAVTPAGDLRVRAITGTFTWASSLVSHLSPLGSWPIGG